MYAGNHTLTREDRNHFGVFQEERAFRNLIMLMMQKIDFKERILILDNRAQGLSSSHWIHFLEVQNAKVQTAELPLHM